MSDEKKTPGVPPTPAGNGEATEAKPGGFGAFGEVYRARWAANHPEAGKRKPTPAAPDAPTATPPDSDDAGPAGNGTRPSSR